MCLIVGFTQNINKLMVWSREGGGKDLKEFLLEKKGEINGHRGLFLDLYHRNQSFKQRQDRGDWIENIFSNILKE